MTGTQITDNILAPIYYSNVTYFGFDLGSGANSLLINNATLKINQDNAISAGIDVTIDGGIFNLNTKTDTIGVLLLKSGSVINGALHANAYNIESGTVTANLAGPGGIQKTTTSQATTGALAIPSVTVTAGQLTVTSINTGHIRIGPGAKLSVSASAAGPVGAPSAENDQQLLAADVSLTVSTSETSDQPVVDDAASSVTQTLTANQTVLPPAQITSAAIDTTVLSPPADESHAILPEVEPLATMTFVPVQALLFSILINEPIIQQSIPLSPTPVLSVWLDKYAPSCLVGETGKFLLC